MLEAKKIVKEFPDKKKKKLERLQHSFAFAKD